MRSLAELTPAGTSTYSKSPLRFPVGCPDLAIAGRGPYLIGSDGRRYIDLVSGMGAIILGYRDPDVDAAVTAQLGNGVSFSLPTALEAEVAETVCRLVPGAEMVRFMKNGADACATAVRLARAITGRERIITIGYHGYQDSVLAPPAKGVPRAVQDLRTEVPFGDIEAMTRAIEIDEAIMPACVIMEPVVATNPVLPTPGYLQAIRVLCDTYGALLVFDEVVTGFRMAVGGAQEAYGVRADLIAAGKAMANGFPLSIVCGPRRHMELLDGRVFCSTTFGGETLSLAAAQATLTKLESQRVPTKLAQFGNRLMRGFELAAGMADLTAEVRIIGYPQRPVIQWRRDALRAAFGQRMMTRGFLFGGYINLTLAHYNDPAVEIGLLDAFTDALQAARGVLAEAPSLPVGEWK